MYHDSLDDFKWSFIIMANNYTALNCKCKCKVKITKPVSMTCERISFTSFLNSGHAKGNEVTVSPTKTMEVTWKKDPKTLTRKPSREMNNFCFLDWAYATVPMRGHEKMNDSVFERTRYSRVLVRIRSKWREVQDPGRGCFKHPEEHRRPPYRKRLVVRILCNYTANYRSFMSVLVT